MEQEKINNSHTKRNASPSTFTHAATVSEAQDPASKGDASQEINSIAEIPSYVVDATSVVSVASHHHQQQQHQQLQHFHSQFYSFQTNDGHSESQLYHYYNTQRASMNLPQYYPSLQEHLSSSSSFHDEQQQQQQHQQQHQHHCLHLQHQQQQVTPMQSNYFSTPRDDCTIHVAAGKSPTENVSSVHSLMISI